MYAETPNKIILVGALRAREVTSLADYCDRLNSTGLTALRVDIGGVTDCDRAALNGLRVLAKGTCQSVLIEGARWSQFLTMLAAEPIADVPSLCDSVRELVEAVPAGQPARTGRRRPARSRRRAGDIGETA